jgi:hypothetical protein
MKQWGSMGILPPCVGDIRVTSLFGPYLAIGSRNNGRKNTLACFAKGTGVFGLRETIRGTDNRGPEGQGSSFRFARHEQIALILVTDDLSLKAYSLQ